MRTLDFSLHFHPFINSIVYFLKHILGQGLFKYRCSVVTNKPSTYIASIYQSGQVFSKSGEVMRKLEASSMVVAKRQTENMKNISLFKVDRKTFQNEVKFSKITEINYLKSIWNFFPFKNNFVRLMTKNIFNQHFFFSKFMVSKFVFIWKKKKKNNIMGKWMI